VDEETTVADFEVVLFALVVVVIVVAFSPGVAKTGSGVGTSETFTGLPLVLNVRIS